MTLEYRKAALFADRALKKAGNRAIIEGKPDVDGEGTKPKRGMLPCEPPHGCPGKPQSGNER